MAQNFGIYFFERLGRGGHSSTRTPPRISRSQDRLKKRREGGTGGMRGTGGGRRFFTGVSTLNGREKAASCENSVCHREPPAVKGDREKWERRRERDRRRAGSVSRGPHSYISRETKTERSLGRGRNLLSSRCRRCRNRKTHRQPVFFSLFARGRLFLPRRSRGTPMGPGCVRETMS